MKRISMFLRVCVCRNCELDYIYLLQWFKTLYYMTEFMRETIPIICVTGQVKDLILELFKEMYEDGYCEPITDADEITKPLIDSKLIIPVYINSENMIPMKMALLDFHSFLSAGKFIVICDSQLIAEEIHTTSFKIIGKGTILPYQRDLIVKECRSALKKRQVRSFIHEYVLKA